MRIDQLPRSARGPGPWSAPPHVARRLSPVPPRRTVHPNRCNCRMRNMLAGNSDGIAIDRSRAVITPARSRRISHLRFVAGEAVVLRLTVSSWDNTPVAHPDFGVHGGVLVPDALWGLARTARPFLRVNVAPVLPRKTCSACSRTGAHRSRSDPRGINIKERRELGLTRRGGVNPGTEDLRGANRRWVPR
jgi:hypothetical protein